MAVSVHTIDFKIMTPFGLVGGCQRHSCPEEEGTRRHRPVNGQQRSGIVGSRLSAGYNIGVVGSNSTMSAFLCVLSRWAVKSRSTEVSPDTLQSLRADRKQGTTVDSRRRFVRWARHVARVGYRRGAYSGLVGKPGGKRPLWRPRCMWKDYIKMDLQEEGWGRGLD